jgi:hypothetical protein
VKRVLALEAEVRRLQAELEGARAEARRRVERRDLVPLAEARWPFGNRSGTR